MSKLLDPKNDYVFKRLFADNPALLADLINAVRHRAAPITGLRVRNPTIDAAELQGKYIILDLLAEDAEGAQFNAEMQVRRHRAWSARSTYYLAKLISNQLLAGDDYGLLCPAIGIHLLDFDLFRDPRHAQQALWCFEMRDADTPTVTLGQEMALYLIEMKKADRIRERLPPALAAWITLFEHWQEDDLMATITHEPVRKARDKLVTLSADAETRRLAFVRERALLDEASLLKDAREEGREEGKDAARRETALNLIRQSSLDDAAIAAATGLDATAVAALRTPGD
jgi:predicted transposase/invertase (TIGR01784 family)